MTAKSASGPQIRKNFEEVQNRVQSAAVRSGRLASSVRIVGVTKYVGSQQARELVEAGCLDLAESRPQALWEKSAQLPCDVRWHLIGHLQRNKVKKTLPLLSMLHSLDSERLMEQLVLDARGLSRPLEALLEINGTDDSTKTGLMPQDAAKLLARYVDAPDMHSHLKIRGLMGMSTLRATADQIHREFESLRRMRDGWSKQFSLEMPELSMGMSDDYEIAIEEGSTMVRIGSRLFVGSDA
ncbi:MAG: YggS family pyridoxal phosphate-dependent enzyme [Pirellula sp.]|jgi:pyridoxal phosphate enzyme (YggS family)